MTQTSAELGKTAGKDTATDKATWPAVFGIERSRHDADALIPDAFAALEPFGDAADPSNPSPTISSTARTSPELTMRFRPRHYVLIAIILALGDLQPRALASRPRDTHRSP